MPSVANIPQTISDYALAAGVDPNIALEQAITESDLNPNAVGAAGEIGIFQLLPSSFPGVNIKDPQTNIQTGIAYLASLLSQFGMDYPTALAAYNWGPGNVAAAIAKYGSDWLSYAPSSTQNYVAKILGNSQTQYSIGVPIDTSIPSDATAASDVAFNPSTGDYVDATGNVVPAPTESSGGLSLTAVLIGLAVILGAGIVLGMAE